MSAFQLVKFQLAYQLGLSKDAMHLYIGLLVFFAVALFLRRPVAGVLPLAAVLAAALGGEVLDIRDQVAAGWGPMWDASLHDLANTCFWPAVIVLLARATTVFERPVADPAAPAPAA